MIKHLKPREEKEVEFYLSLLPEEDRLIILNDSHRISFEDKFNMFKNMNPEKRLEMLKKHFFVYGLTLEDIENFIKAMEKKKEKLFFKKLTPKKRQQFSEFCISAR